MKSEELFDGITGIQDDIIEEAQNTEFIKERTSRKKWFAAAAAFVIVIGAGGVGIRFWRGTTGARSGGFTSYAGPVFPLTLKENADGITASRDLTYDVAPRDPDGDGLTDILATDAYTLQNESDKDRTVTAIVPFAGSFSMMKIPTVKVNGLTSDAGVHAGSYNGYFTGTAGNTGNESTNLSNPKSWEDYKALLSDGSYRAEALENYPELNQPVTVYRFTDPVKPAVGRDSATLAVEFHIDTGATTVFTYGFNGASLDRNGYRRFSFFVPDAGGESDSMRVMIVLGQDIGNYTLKGYQDGSCDSGKEVEGVTATVTRYESTFGEVLYPLVKEHANRYLAGNQSDASLEMYYGALCRFLMQYSAIGSEPKARYAACNLNDLLSDVSNAERVMYLTFPVTIPAHQSVTVEVDSYQAASYHFVGNRRTYGYDMVTKLDTNLTFKSLTASIRNADTAEMIQQNFGFDLTNNITKVELDPENKHYYMEISPAAG